MKKEPQSISLKDRFFPIKNYELKKIIPLCLLKGITSFVFSILFSIKDAAIVTSNQSGAEVIPVLKSALVLPSSILIVLLFYKLSNTFNPLTVRYIIISSFLILFFIYGFILLPNESTLTPSISAERLLEVLGAHNKHWVAVYRYWIHSIFFVVSELWGQVCLFILFWGFVNQICSIDEAKRSYNLFIASGSLGGMMQAPFIFYFKSQMSVLILIIIFSSLLMMVLYWGINKYSLSDNRLYNSNLHDRTSKTKTKLSLFQSIKYIFSSKYLIAIAITVISCGLTINLVQITWKANLKSLYFTKDAYLSFMSFYDLILNVISFFIVFFISGSLIRKLGWKFCSLVPPLVIGITGILFFFMSKYQGALIPFSNFLGIKPLVMVVYFGAFQAVASKVSKYSFFDITKEIVYIPLGQEGKVKGKAAVDTIGSRFGKSSSSFVHLLALWFATSSEVLSITIILIPCLIIVVIGWIYAVKFLDKNLKKKVQEKKDILSFEPIEN